MPRKLTLQEDALEFATEFVRRMRAYPDLPLGTDPSPRQAIAIPSILTSRLMRQGFLRPDDFITAAVATSYVDNQEIALKIATEILTRTRYESRISEVFRGEGQQALARNRTLSHAIEGAEELGSKVEETGSRSGAGLGDESFTEWARLFRGQRDYRRRLYEMAERIRMASSSSCEFTAQTIEDSGILDGEKLQHFEDSSDPDLVDFEESIESIISLGKRLSEITPDDLMVRERRGQRKSIVFLEDISGSMGASLKYSMLCMVLLLYAFRKHELALAFFEGNPYIVREFFSKESVDETIERVLSANPMYGTMGGKVLEWARRHLAQVDGRYYEKLCVICSDMGFHDIERVLIELKKMKQEGVEVLIIVPPGFVYRSYLDEVERKIHPLVIELDEEKMTRFPEVVSGAFARLRI